jgi:AraC-like DNA-binding protein
VSVAVVLSGTFTYGNTLGRALLTPGAFLLGTPGNCFTCGHEHASGDRCLAFYFEPAFFEEIAAAAGARTAAFRRNSLPALRSLAPLAARAASVACGAPIENGSMEELALDLAAAALQENTARHLPPISARDEQRVTSVVRHLSEAFAEPWGLHDLAHLAGLSQFHFLRVFRITTGLTPHQHLLRTRLRSAAVTLASTATPITEVALDVGFDDLSNFIRTFRAEYGMTPSRYRAREGRNLAPNLAMSRPKA